MSEVKFKVGDLVYYPNISNKIGEIVGTSIIANDPFPFKVVVDDTVIFITEDGKFMANAPMPVIYHATQENYEWLSATFPNVAFEPPPKRKEPKEIIKAMLKAGYDGVPCKTECGRYRYICTAIIENEFFSFKYDNCANECSAYSSGIPYHPKTGQKIIDFVDGKCVLENGEVILEDKNV